MGIGGHASGNPTTLVADEQKRSEVSDPQNSQKPEDRETATEQIIGIFWGARDQYEVRTEMSTLHRRGIREEHDGDYPLDSDEQRPACRR